MLFKNSHLLRFSSYKYFSIFCTRVTFFTANYHYERDETNTFLPVKKTFFTGKKTEIDNFFYKNSPMAKFENNSKKGPQKNFKRYI